jgi:methylenetetrahydrofolate reductase (NADPH)
MRYADELVGFIRDTTGDHFHIEVAAYPEVHPDSPGLPSEIHYFKQKVEAGADSAITQYFYVAEAYFNFVEACAKAGVDVPIVPGVMPITNYASLLRFSDKCQAEVPRWLRKKLEAYDDGSEDLRRAGEEVVTELCRRLLDWGAPGLHFYTINQSLPTRRIWRNLFD